VESDSNR
jgi:hypothetical protein